MKITPTSTFTSLSKALHKHLRWRVYVRKTTDLSESLTLSNWTEVSSRCDFSSIASSSEIEVAQSTTDNVTLTAIDYPWWLANVLNATDDQYIECKITAELGSSDTTLASDVIPMFYGYIDKVVEPSTDSIEFDLMLRSADDLMTSIPGEYVTLQRFATVSGYNCLLLQGIPGVYVYHVSDIPDFLTVGAHTVSYRYNGGAQQVKLNGGAWTSIGGLSNVTDENGLVMTIYTVTDELTEATLLEQQVVVIEEGEQYPYTWYKNTHINEILKKIYGQIGITTLNFDEFTLTTYDDRKVASAYDVPPGTGGTFTRTSAMCDAGGKLWFAIGNKIYARQYDSATYTLIATPTSDTVQAFYTDRVANNELWAMTLDTLIRIDLTDDSFDTYTITFPLSHKAIAFNASIGTDGAFQYLTNPGGSYQIKQFDVDTLVESTFNASITADRTFTGIAYSDGTDYYAEGLSLSTETPPSAPSVIVCTSSTDDYFCECETMSRGVYHSGKFLFTTLTGSVYSLTGPVQALVSSDKAASIIYADGKWIWASQNGDHQRIMYSSDGSTTSTLTGDIDMSGACLVTDGQYMAYVPSIDVYFYMYPYQSLLAKFDSSLSMYCDAEASFEGKTLREALNDMLNAFLLLARVSTTKAVRVMRRCDDTGAPVSTGDTYTFTNANVSSATVTRRNVERVVWIEVSNGTDAHNYNGTDFDTGEPLVGRTMSVTNRFIPSTLLKDFAYYLWAFFSENHDMVKLTMALETPLQLEVFDGADITASNANLSITATGIIHSVEVAKSGEMVVNVTT